MTKVINRSIQLGGESRVVGASSTSVRILEFDRDGQISRAYGATVPTDDDAGYAVGCSFIDNDGGVGATYYINEGSTSSCDFNVSAGTTGDITAVTAGAGMTGGGASGAVTLNVINTDGKITVGADTIDITADSLENVDIKTTAAIAYSKLAVTPANKMIAGVSNVATVCAVAGDLTMTSAGTDATFAIASDVIINADIKTDAAIAVSKIALATGSLMLGTTSVGAAIDASTDTAILIGNGSTAAMQTIGGDATMANDGTLSVTDITVASEAQGDIYIRGASGLERLAAGTSGKFLKTQGAAANPIWDAPTVGNADALVSPFTIEGGTYDPETTVTAQTSSAAALTIPNLAGTAQEWVFTKVAQTLTSKTLTSPVLTTPSIVTTGSITDAGGDEYIVFIEDSTPIEHLQLTTGDAGIGVQLKAETSATNADLHLDAAGSGDIIVDSGSELTFARATFNALVVIADQTGENHTFNIPDIATGASDTFAFLAEAQTFTNKTLTSPVLTTPSIVTTGSITDAGGSPYITFVEDTTPRDSFQLTTGDAGLGAKLEVITDDTNANFIIDAAGTGDFQISNGTELTFLRGTFDALVVVADQAGEAHTFNIPNIVTGASDTFAFLAEAQTLTNKSIDADTNTITNINATELDPVADGNFAVPFICQVAVANLAAAGANIQGTTHPKMRVIGAWFEATSADSGTIAVHVGQTGSIGAVIINTLTITATDEKITPAISIDNSASTVAANAGLVAVGDVGASIDGIIYVHCIPVN